MPFIRYTSIEKTADGNHEQIHFINLGQVSSVTYDKAKKTLSIFIGDRPGGKGTSITLDKNEAEEALKVCENHYHELLNRQQ